MAKQDLKKRLNSKDKELKNPEQIVRQRMRLEHIKRKETMNKIKKDSNRKKHAKQQKKRTKKWWCEFRLLFFLICRLQ